MQRAQCLIHNCTQLKPLIVHQVERSFCLNISKPSIIPKNATVRFVQSELKQLIWFCSPPWNMEKKKLRKYLWQKKPAVYKYLMIYSCIFSICRSFNGRFQKLLKPYPQPACLTPPDSACIGTGSWTCCPATSNTAINVLLAVESVTCFYGTSHPSGSWWLKCPPSMHNCAQNLFSNKLKWSPMFPLRGEHKKLCPFRAPYKYEILLD